MVLTEKKGKFAKEAMFSDNEKWEQAVQRTEPLYQRKMDIRSEFGRDYTRILHSTAYRRLKYKTQVYFLPVHDHVSTRIDHVHYVESISRLIADDLGLNGELAATIALGHDLGHPPFGHIGEQIIAKIADEAGVLPFCDGVSGFWHGKNGLRVVDDLELLTGKDGRAYNLNLTYAVRDGIISHSGSGMCLKPRKEAVDLKSFQSPGQFMPFSWEACVVKLADNIAYLGRDIDDALTLGLIDREASAELNEIVSRYEEIRGMGEKHTINNANIINLLVTDLCSFSSPEKGIGFSEAGRSVAEAVLSFNRKKIYGSPKLRGYQEYGECCLRRIFNVLLSCFRDYDANFKAYEKLYPILIKEFSGWIRKYWDRERESIYANHILYDTQTDEKAFGTAAIDFLSEMTDRYIEKVYHEQMTF